MAMNKNATLEALKTAVRTQFQRGMQGAKSQLDAVATVIPSTTAINTYAWLDDFPHMRKWVGARVIKDMKEQAYQITNDKYESTFGIKVDDIDDNNIGHYGTLGLARGREVVKHENRLVYNQLKNGLILPCFDGQNFFDLEHPVNAEVDGTGADTLVSNVIDGTATDHWYLTADDEVIKPVILQRRMEGRLTDKVDDSSDHVFMNDEYLMGLKWRGAAGFGFWQTAICGKVALDQAAFNEGFEMMSSFKAHGGDPLGIMPTKLVVPPKLRSAALEVVEVMNLENGKSNPNYKAVSVEVVPWLA